MTRAERRAHAARLKRRAANLAALLGLDPDGREARKLARTPKPCSCPVCGNPRKWTGRTTRAERWT